MQERVEQHRAVPVGLDEAVSVRPARRQRIELQMPVEKRRGDIRAARRRPRVPSLARTSVSTASTRTAFAISLSVTVIA